MCCGIKYIYQAKTSSNSFGDNNLQFRGIDETTTLVALVTSGILKVKLITGINPIRTTHPPRMHIVDKYPRQIDRPKTCKRHRIVEIF